ncbi:hypothetical protein F1B92_05070 [Campylobacter sp. FMV-PI01]|uniref:Glycosyl hydrolase n=1 Tax=Campylobacter portucalensis TaxID=2608384 RepID=A0A6L5WL24_9BACT|nr:hypothetical protein [Campylobacter portucalensis]MSN96543.1 hypothetical protein [Campylobacter portucalensis]
MKFEWDYFSDQPKVIKDKAFKKKMRKKYIFDFLIMFIKSIFILPFATLIMKFFKGKNELKNSEFYGLCVNLDKGDEQINLANELGVKNLLIRVFLSDINNIDKYYEFASKFKDKNILICVVQDRKSIENLLLLKNNLEIIFSKFSHLTDEFQIGIAINRLKWGFFAPKEYLDFYEVAQNLRDKKFKNLKLLAPSVIDFEYHYNVATMFNFKNIKFDKISSLLYVDRRGSPTNTQFGIFNLKNKINLLYALSKLSPKSSDEIYITETNYPIINTAPYAPTSQKECVSIEDYTKFMLEYHKIAKKSGKIKRVYWHQLIAPGYGLVDNRDDKIIKMPQFYAYKKMINEDFN